MKRMIYLSALLFLLLLSCDSGQSLRVEKLFCEYAENPIALETREPRFSWLLRSSQRGQQQTAWQVLVGSSEENIRRHIGDMWDSGRIGSNQSTHVPYQGKRLQSHSVYYWQVRVWDREGTVSHYSKPARFETAFLGGSEWRAKWIGMGKSREPHNERGFYNSPSQQFIGGDSVRHEGRSILLRKTFSVSKKVKRAKIYACGLGLYELRLNGKKVGDALLAPPKTLYTKRILFDTYDVTALLKQGGNAIGIHLGNGWFNPYKKWWSWRMQWFGSKRAILEMRLEYEDGTSEVVVTDESWKADFGPITYACIYDGEHYDARLEQPGWDQAEFDDSAWEQATVAVAPKGRLVSRSMPPIRMTRTIKPVRMYNPREGVYLFDMGQNFAGWVRIRVAGAAGTEIKCRFSENIKNGTLDRRSMNLAGAAGSYTLKGEGDEIYEPRFVFYGFRYVEVTGFPVKPSLDDVTGCVVHSDCRQTGSFECGSDLINQIHQNTVWSQRSNMVGYPMDCPQRDERLGWMGDAHVAAEEAIHNFYMPLFYQNWLSGIRVNQAPNGDLPYISPRPYMEPGTIAWSAAYPLIVWYHYLYYGDKRIIEEHYETIKRYLSFLDSQAEQFILKPDRYGDWLSVTPGWGRGKPAAASTGYYFYIARLLSQMASVLGLTDEYQKFLEQASKIMRAYNKKYFDPVKNIYEEGSQFSNVFPLFLGIVSEGHKSAVLKNLIANINDNCGHLTTGILGSKYIMDLLAGEDENDIACLLTSQKDYPGWGYLVQGRTTLSEHWNQTGSNNHVMFGSVDRWFYRALAGINVDEQKPGYERIIFKPWVHPEIGWAKASLETMRGTVASEWRYKNGNLRVNLTVPVNSTALLYLPATDPGSVKESGKPIRKSVHVRRIGQDRNDFIYFVDSGTYSFVSRGIERLIDKPYVSRPKILPEKRFYLSTDIVNIEMRCDTKGAKIRYTTDGSEPTERSPVFKSMNISKSIQLKAKAFRPGYHPSFTRTADYQFINADVNGALYQVFLGEFSSVNQFARVEPNRSGLAFHFGLEELDLPDDDFGLIFTGYLDIRVEGLYHFYSLSNDGSRIYIDDELVVDNDGGHLAIEKSGKMALNPGKHKIVVKYFQTGGGKELKVSYKGPGIEKKEIPAHLLFQRNENRRLSSEK